PLQAVFQKNGGTITLGSSCRAPGPCSDRYMSYPEVTGRTSPNSKVMAKCITDKHIAAFIVSCGVLGVEHEDVSV
ncbi:hypothetical protein KI387_042209, partial [Taxus chinensis]